MKKFSIPLVTSLAVLTGCGDGGSGRDAASLAGKPPSTVTVTATAEPDTSPTVPSPEDATTNSAPGDTEYESAMALATALERSGFLCSPEDKGGSDKSTWAKCTVPTPSGGDPLHFTVWKTSELAVAGIESGLKYSKSLADLVPGGPGYYMVTGKNWQIDADHDRDAAQQIADKFGGTVRAAI